MKYDVAYGDTREELIEMVGQFILAGWEPLGGVAVSIVRVHDIDGGTRYYEWWAQAVIRI